MLRNKPFNALQKIYDDSYLSCSTAVYYESQGDELEAMRHWRIALERIYGSRGATKETSGRGSQTDTEKALMGAIKELELQCKERVDLLKVLRVSRLAQQETSFDEHRTMRPTLNGSTSSSKGSIGQGTIPAITWSDLSRPQLPSRPSFTERIASENAVGRVRGSGSALNSSPSHPRSDPATRSSKDDLAARSSSPDKHTMRTTLRSGKLGENPPKSTRKSPVPPADGPSKAATLAWSALGPRDRLRKARCSDGAPSTSTLSHHKTSDRSMKLGTAQSQWDSNSRRLVIPSGSDSFVAKAPSPGALQHPEALPCPKPSPLSVTAASSAINSSNQEPASTDRQSNRAVSSSASRRALATASLSDTSSHALKSDSKASAESGYTSQGTTGNTTPDRRGRRAAQTRRLVGVARDRDRISRAQTDKLAKPRPSYVSSSSGDESLGPLTAAIELVDQNAASSAEIASEKDTSSRSAGKTRFASTLKSLPPGLDEAAVKQILNDIVVQGDEVHWGDVAGLKIAKNALRETVVYPFLRPDLFMGLREPARGMLLFGPPGTGKTMLARAVATESKSTFFSISASSLTSKYLGESEKLVKALFDLARTLAPSIIVDEIDSLLSQRSGSGEHEATRRIKTEFLIQWSDLQRAAAGRDVTDRDKERDDANRVLVLAATNLPWAIDEAARRRFVRRQYIPLPEPHIRETQLRTLLGQQKHSLVSSDIQKLVALTDGFSGSDITALAKDAAMGPLRSLGEALLHMTMDEIRPIMLQDFEASLTTIRPSVSKAGLKEYEDWTKEFRERGG